MLAFESDRVPDKFLTFTEDTARDGHSFLCGMVCDTELALVSVASAVTFIQACWVLMTLFAEVCICVASEFGDIAAEVTLELNMTETVLVTHEPLLDAHVLQATALTHKLLFFHAILLSLHILSHLLALAVHVPTEERVVAARAFVKLTDMQGELDWSSVITVIRIL